MVYRSPMVLTFIPENFTIKTPAITAMSDPGIFSLIFGHTIRIARLMAPTRKAYGLNVPKLSPKALSLSTVSIVTVPCG